jgi:SSS family transporter
MTEAGLLTGVDWIVLAGYLALVVGGGVWLARAPKDSRDFFVGHGQMPGWAVALSVLASALSVATYLGAPAEAYKGNLTYLISNLGAFAAVLVVAWVFVPAFYRYQVVTVYQVLEHRFGPPAAVAASWTFLVGRTLASGVRLYFAVIPVGLMLGAGDHPGMLCAAIAGLATVAVLYALIGGIASIIWTDVVQFAVMIVAVLAAVVVLWVNLPVDAATAWQVVSTPAPQGADKLVWLDWSFDLSHENTLWTALSGYLLLNLAAYGTDQDLAQRMLTCRNAVAGGRSALGAILMNLPVVALFMLVGVLLFVFFRVTPAGAIIPEDQAPAAKDAFTHFILTTMPSGLRGLMLAGLFAIAFTSLLSAVNAMASAFITDCYRRVVVGREDQHYLRASRWAVVGAGAVVAGTAMLCIPWHRATGMNLLGFAFNAAVMTSSGLLGVFLCALLTKRGSWRTAIVALVAAFAVALALQPNWWPDDAALCHMAWPWRMVLATVVSLAICCMGKPKVVNA